jgi:Domain of unknown function (DUF1906)
MSRLHSPLFGLDSTSEVPSSAHHACGSRFACRYLSHYAPKVPSPSEIRDYHDQSIGLVLVFEDDARRALDGYQQGKLDGEFALHQATTLGVKRCCYFAVDFDTAGHPEVTDGYFNGLAAVWGKEHCGPYGSYEVVARQSQRGFAYCWQTYAWSGGRVHPKAQILQYSNGRMIGGVGVDFNKAFDADYGQWGYRPDAPPRDYDRYPVGPFLDPQGQRLSERSVVQAWDGLNHQRHPEQSRTLHGQLVFLRKRVWFIAHSERDRAGRPSWGVAWRGWRWQELLERTGHG